MMRLIIILAGYALLHWCSIACASEVNRLAACTVKIFKEINRSHKWSGKPPTGCPSTLAVERRPDGVYVTIWQSAEEEEDKWVNTAFSAAEGFGEIADKKGLARANRDIMARAARLGNCLDSIVAANDPLECRQTEIKSYNAGDIMGTEMRRTIRLDDGGRYAVVEFSHGDSATLPPVPADLIETSPLSGGIFITVIPRVGGDGKHGKKSKGTSNTPDTRH